MDLSVVIPALNEASNLAALLPDLHRHLRALDIEYEIVVVDGGSTDRTTETSADGGARVVSQSRQGYGNALSEGFADARGTFVLTMDADYSHEPVFVGSLWAKRHDSDCVIASRYVAGGSADMSRTRLLMSRALNEIYRRLLGLPFRDLSSGFRLYRMRALGGVSVRGKNFDFLPELLVRLYAEGYRVEEVPFHYRPRHDGRSHARLVRFGLSFARTLVRMRRLRRSVLSADYDERAFDSLIPLQRYWQRQRKRIIVDYLDTNARVLDIGCGSSRVIQALPRGIGMDLQIRKLRYLRGKVPQLLSASLTKLPFPDACFQQVLCSEVIEHVPRSDVDIQEFHRVLRPGGTLVIGTPDYSSWIWVNLERVYGFVSPGGYADEHINHYTETGLRQELEELGFVVREVRKICRSEMIFKVTKPLPASSKKWASHS